MKGMISSSAPSFQRPKLSPMSQFRSMNFFSIPSSPSAAPAWLAAREHAGERVDEAIDVLLAHRQGAGAHAALGEQDTFVQQTQEHTQGRVGVLRPAAPVVR